MPGGSGENHETPQNCQCPCPDLNWAPSNRCPQHYQCTNLLSKHADHGHKDCNAMQFGSYVPTYWRNLLPAPGMVVHPPDNRTLHPPSVHQLTYWTSSCLWRMHSVEILALFFRALQYTHLTPGVINIHTVAKNATCSTWNDWSFAPIIQYNIFSDYCYNNC